MSCGRPDCKSCNPRPCWTEPGGSSGQTRDVVVPMLAPALSPIRSGQWSTDKATGQEYVSGKSWVTLDATRGNASVQLVHEGGRAILTHGRPVYVGTSTELAIGAADRTSQALLIVASYPLWLGPARGREIAATLPYATLVPPTPPAAALKNSMVYTPSQGGIYIVARAGAVDTAIVVTELWDPGDGGPLEIGAAPIGVSAAIAAGEVGGFAVPAATTGCAVLVTLDASTGAGTGFVRILGVYT